MPPPGFQDTSDEPTSGGQLQTLQPLSHELIASVLDARDYSFHTDEDGDIFGKWDDNLIYFFRLGNAGELLQIRTMAASTFGIDDVPRLYAFCNEWNHDRLWPKAFVHVNDDGSVRVCGEVITDLEQGVTTAQLDQLLNCGISTGCQMADAVAELRD
ncbi:YbjN domain-containing protein [Polymorphospora sp. NPDC051019]|uniref:YbjN domain-containing protein n=1 Tax=Polymorphospora sp. NPDC051019 TaxID=3155725 RepID=UPI003442BB70